MSSHPLENCRCGWIEKSWDMDVIELLLGLVENAKESTT